MRPLTRAAPVERLHCCNPLPVGEGRDALLQIAAATARFSLSHRERAAEVQRLGKSNAGEGNWLDSRALADMFKEYFD